MANLSTFSITLGATDYPVKYAGLLAYVEPYLTNLENFSFPGGGAVSIAGAFSAASISTTGAFSAASISTTGDLQAASFNGGQLAGMRNKIINGKMEIAQRGTSFAAAVTGSYTLDRWSYNGVAGTSVATVSQQSDVPASNEFQSSLRVAVTTADTSIAAGEGIWLTQVIEGYNARDLIGRAFTLSFWVRSSKTGTHCVAMRNSGENRSYVAEYTVSAANTWEQKSLTVSGGLITAGTWDWTNGAGLKLTFALAAGSTFQTTAGAWQTGNFLATANQVNCLDTIGNIFAITGVQLEVGLGTPYEHRPYQIELALAQRYFCKTFNTTVAPAQNVGLAGALFFTGYGAGGFRTTWVYPVEMRAAPTLASFNPSAANSNWRGVGGSIDYGVVASIGAGTRQTDVGTGASLAGTEVYAIHLTASSEL